MYVFDITAAICIEYVSKQQAINKTDDDVTKNY